MSFLNIQLFFFLFIATTTATELLSFWDKIPVSSKISVATINMLFDDFYKKNVEKDGKNRPIVMPLNARLGLFEKAFEKGGACYGVDVICMQEFAIGDAALHKILQKNGYKIIEPILLRKDSAACAIAYKQNKLIFKSKRQFQLGSNTQIAVEFELATLHQGPHVKVFSVHVPWQGNEDTQKHLENFKKIINYASQWLASTDGFTIVSGDFNYNSFNDASSYQQLANIFDSQVWHDANKGNLESVTSYYKNFKLIDYMFYTHQTKQHEMVLKDFFIVPSDPLKLIKHTVPKNKADGPMFDTKNGHWSDHAVLRAEFEIK